MKEWILDAGNSGIEPSYSKDTDSLVDVYNMQGLMIKADVDPRLATDSLPLHYTSLASARCCYQNNLPSTSFRARPSNEQ